MNIVKKMGNPLKILLLITSFFVINTGFGQNVSFIAQGPGAVEVGEQFAVKFVVNNRPSSLNPPSFANFNFLGGPQQSSMSSTSYVNGKMSSTVEYSYTYYLSASKTGKFKIDGATATIDGKTYKSNSINIEVVAGAKNTNQPNTANNQTSTTSQENSKTFFVASVSKSNLYIGESAIMTIKIYSKEQLTGIDKYEPGQVPGFWQDKIDIGQIHLERETYNGQVYNAVLLAKQIIYPQKSGKLTIQPFKIQANVVAQRTRAPRDYFEQMMYGNKVVEQYQKTLDLKSSPIVINVKDLPANKPSSFNGLVGKFDMKARLDRNKVNANDALNLKVTISGTGNISLAETPKPIFPPDFEIYDPKINQNTNGNSGSKTYEYLIIPRNEGKYQIPAFELSYFDVQTGNFKTLSSGDFLIEVGKGNPNSKIVNTSALNQDEVKFLNSDIRYISLKTKFIKKDNNLLFSIIYWLIILLSIILTVVIIIILKKKLAERENVGLMKNKKATLLAKKRLKKAKSYLDKNLEKEFYNELSDSLWGYISDKFYIQVSELSIDNIKNVLESKNTDTSLINAYVDLLNDIEFARFAPQSSNKDSKHIYNQALDVIVEIEKNMK